MKTQFISALALAAGLGLVASGAAQAATQSSTFDTDAEGWTVFGGVLGYMDTGGNPGGYITARDNLNNFMELVAPASYTGISLLNGGMLSFDFINDNGVGGTSLSGFGTVTLQGGGLSAELDITSALPGSAWQTASTTLSSTVWGLSEPNWTTLISDITAIRIEVESLNGLIERVGFDNFKVDVVAPIPLPAGLPLALGGLAALGLLKRRASRA